MIGAPHSARGLYRYTFALVLAATILLNTSCQQLTDEAALAMAEMELQPAHDVLREGRRVFLHDTFGNEAFWGGQLRLHAAIAGRANGGVGPGISPAAALALGLKVDLDALPAPVRNGISRGTVDLNDPATTVALLRLNAVIGVTGFFDDAGKLQSVGIQCALCHVAVDDRLAPGVGRRLEGYPNRDLDVGAIIAAAPDLTVPARQLGVTQDALRIVLKGWGRGKFDAFVFLDGKVTRPDGGSAAALIPPLFGLQGVGLMTWNGWSGIGSWIPLVATLEMHGRGTFSDSRLRDATQFPVAAANNLSRVQSSPDLVTSKLPALTAYVLSLEPPKPPAGSFDPAAAARGQAIFNGKGRCSNCHVPPIYSLPGWNVVSPQAIGIDSFQADRSPSRGYRPPPLRGMFTREKGGFFHDGRFKTLPDVVNHFDRQFQTMLTPPEKADLVQFLLSL